MSGSISVNDSWVSDPATVSTNTSSVIESANVSVNDSWTDDPVTASANASIVSDSASSVFPPERVTIAGTNDTSNSVTIAVITNDLVDTEFTTNNVSTVYDTSNEVTGDVTNTTVGSGNVSSNGTAGTDTYTNLQSATPTTANEKDCEFLWCIDFFLYFNKKRFNKLLLLYNTRHVVEYRRLVKLLNWVRIYILNLVYAQYTY